MVVVVVAAVVVDTWRATLPSPFALAGGRAGGRRGGAKRGKGGEADGRE